MGDTHAIDGPSRHGINLTTTASMDDATANGRRWTRMRARVRWLFDPQLLDWMLRRFDQDPRVIGLGVVIGLAYAVLMAGNVDRDHPGLAKLVAALAVAAPTAGVSIIATLA